MGRECNLQTCVICPTAFVGVRLAVGGSGPDNAPTAVRIAGRQVQLKPNGTKRWYDLPLTSAEALAVFPDVTLQVAVTAFSDSSHL